MRPALTEANHSSVLDLCLSADAQHAQHVSQQLENIYLYTYGLDFLVDDQKQTALHILASKLDFDQWDAILNGFVYLDAVDANNQTALLIAVQCSNICAIRYLIDNGANPTIEDDHGVNTIKLAIQNNYIEGLLEILKSFTAKQYISNNAIRIGQVCIDSRSLKAFEIIITHLLPGAINSVDDQNYSLVHHVVLANLPDYLRVLVENKAEINGKITVDKAEKTPIELAQYVGVAEILFAKGAVYNKKLVTPAIQELIQKSSQWQQTGRTFAPCDVHKYVLDGNINALRAFRGKVDIIDTFGETPLMYAIRNPTDPAIIDELLAKQANPNLKEENMRMNAFQLAAKLGRDDVLRKLTSRVDPDFNIHDNNNSSLVLLSIMGGNPGCLAAFLEKRPELIADTLEIYKSLLEVEDSAKAAQMIDLLVKAGFQFKLPTKSGKTILREALDRRSFKLAESLVRAGALKLFEDEAASYLIDVVVEEMNIADTFIEFGANPDITHLGRPLIHDTANHKYDKTRKDLLKGHDNLKASRDVNGNLFIHRACMFNNVYSIEDAVKEFGNNVNEPNNNGDTPIHFLMHQPSPDFEKNLRFLADQKVNLFAVNKKGHNIFHVLAEHNNEVTAKFMLTSGIITDEVITKLLNQRDVESKTPLEIASKKTDTSVAKLYSTKSQLPIFNQPVTMQTLSAHIESGYSLNVYNTAGYPLITYAMLQYPKDNQGTIELVKKILENNADPSIPDLCDNEEYRGPLMPLHHAMLLLSVELTSILIDAGANFIVDPVIHCVAEDTKNEEIMALVKLPERRASAIQEIFETQNNAMHIIGAIIEKAKKSKELGNNPKIDSYLSECKLMYRLLTMFVQRIDHIFKGLKPSSEIGNFLVYFADAFLPLLGMAAEYDIAISEMRSIPALEGFLRQTSYGTLSIDDALIVPTQQFTRYPDLIKAVIKVTPKDHSDTVGLQKSLIKYSYIGRTSNERKLIAESQKELRLVQLMTNINENMTEFTLDDILFFKGQFELKEFNPPSGPFSPQRAVVANHSAEWGLKTVTNQYGQLNVSCFNTFGRSMDSFLKKGKIAIFLFRNATLFGIQKTADKFKLKFSCRSSEVLWDFGKEYGLDSVMIYTPFGSMMLKCAPQKGTPANFERNRWRSDVDKISAIDEADEFSPFGLEIVYASWVGDDSKCVHSHLFHVTCENKTVAKEKILKKIEECGSRVKRKSNQLGEPLPLINYDFQTLKRNEGQETQIIADIMSY
ncbi:hypothetical protein TRFO_36836 [Tritrichomonas foetus]|uniref:DH domain-containing protein n=1 Tax=Tritrichomonas foetus TaxID=1144522 RepID=A0A1J4JD18_9EUKA|nr:hypothetical protein TRFO_36836 [Tritrichomonas foetus]|eukprot:OHS97008.1 hypothetical protein TRFO_36836 [Tritrichomonas foetus]